MILYFSFESLKFNRICSFFLFFPHLFPYPISWTDVENVSKTYFFRCCSSCIDHNSSGTLQHSTIRNWKSRFFIFSSSCCVVLLSWINGTLQSAEAWCYCLKGSKSCLHILLLSKEQLQCLVFSWGLCSLHHRFGITAILRSSHVKKIINFVSESW